MKLETVLFAMLALPFALVMLCQVVNGMWMFRIWLNRRRKRKRAR